jgi:hypothetical protein
MPLVDVLQLNVSHMTFLHESLEHRHARVRTVARSALDAINKDVEAGLGACAEESVLERRIEAAEWVDKSTPRGFFVFSKEVMAGLRSGADRPYRLDHRDQNSKAVCCSSYIYKTTTTTHDEEKNNGVAGDKGIPLIYPSRLVGDQRELVNRYLATVPAKSRQSILDELKGRFRAETKGMPPLYDEMSFLFSLCNALKHGQFKANLGIKVVAERAAREKARRESAERAVQTPSTGLEEMRQLIAAGKGPIAEMRRALGMLGRSDTADGSEKSP